MIMHTRRDRPGLVVRFFDQHGRVLMGAPLFGAEAIFGQDTGPPCVTTA